MSVYCHLIFSCVLTVSRMKIVFLIVEFFLTGMVALQYYFPVFKKRTGSIIAFLLLIHVINKSVIFSRRSNLFRLSLKLNVLGCVLVLKASILIPLIFDRSLNHNLFLTNKQPRRSKRPLHMASPVCKQTDQLFRCRGSVTYTTWFAYLCDINA